MTEAVLPPRPDLAVLIPHYNDVARLGTCLAALAPQVRDAGSRVEVVVVDNDSPVDLSALGQAYPWARIVTETEKGAAAARNRGVRESRAPHLAFLDSDCVPAPDWLATALRLAGQADVIGGRIETFDETPPPRSGAEAFEAVFAFQQKAYIEDKGFSVTANLITSRAVFDDVGPMVVGLSEDMDWCFRATARGHGLVYNDALVVAHPTRQDWPALARKWRRTTLEVFHLNGVSPARRVIWAMKALVVAASGPAHLPRVLGAACLRDRTERVRAAGTLLRLRATRAMWMLGQAIRGG